jgi:ATP-dependent exoDNAse (exonuclease V) beta subunit
VRVFYVAATRAKEKLVCLSSRNGRDAGNFASYLDKPEVAGKISVEPRTWDEKKGSVRHAPAVALSKKWNAEKLSQVFRERQQEFKTVADRPVFLTPTGLLKEPEKIRLIEEGGVVASVPAAEIIDSDRANAILVGLLCHKVLEGWDFGGPVSKRAAHLKKAVDQASKYFEVQKGNPFAPRAHEEAHGILEKFLASAEYERLSKVKILGREIPFLQPIGNGQMMRGVIDLLYEQEGRPVVADYKTNRLEKRPINDLVEHYRQQGEAYQEAIRKALGKDARFELVFLREGKTVSL